MTEPIDLTKTDTPPGGLLVAGPWTKRPAGDSDQRPHVLEPVPDDVYDATPVPVSSWQQRLAASADQPVLPLLFRDPERALASTRYVARELARMAAREVLNPKTWFHPLAPTGRGLWRWTRATWRWVSARDVRDDHLRRTGARVATLNEVSEHRKFRAIILASGTAVTGIGELAGYLLVGVEVQVGTGLVVAVAAYLSGRKKDAERPTILSATSAGGLKPGIPLGLLERGVLASLADSRVTAEIAEAPAASRWGWTITVASEEEITDKAIRTMERKLRARRGAISAIPDPENAAQTQLRIVHTDLLANVGPPLHHKPRSLTITRAFDLGKKMDGEKLLLEFLRVHALFVGKTRSGKSSAIWDLIDALTACRDAIVLGIDLSGGPAFNAWGDCVQKVATEPDDARDLLVRLIRVARARTVRLGERSRPRVDGPPPGDENWDPPVDGPAIVVIIDEYPMAVDEGLADLVTTLARIGGKVAVTVVLAAQKAGRNDLGNTTVRAQTAIQGLLPCDKGDIQMIWPGRAAEGWRPDLLRPAVGRHPNDSGKVYLNAVGFDDPSISRFRRMTLKDIHPRAIERMQAGLTEWDAFSQAAYDSDTDVSDLIVHEVPPILRDMADAMDAASVDRMPSADMVRWLAENYPDGYPDITAALTDGDEDKGVKRAQDRLARMLAPYRLSTAQLGGFGNPRGYRREDVAAAISSPGSQQ